MSASAPSPLATPLPWDLVADSYVDDTAPFFEHFANDAMDLAALPAGARTLDVAAGPGTLSLLAAGRGAQVSALDFSPLMLGHLRKRASRSGLSLEILEGDGMALPFADHSFDAAFSMFGLIFFPDRSQGLRELFRVLRPGARAAISSWVPMERMPHMTALFDALRAELPELPFGNGQAPMGTPQELSVELSGAGFTDVRVHELTHAIEAPSMDAFFQNLRRSNPPFVLLEKRLGAEHFRRVSDGVLRQLVAAFGAGPQRVEMHALIGVGTRPA